MKRRRNFVRILIAVLVVFNVTVLPVKAEEMAAYVEPRWNNIGTATLTIGFASNNMGHFSISATPYASCTGISGQMRLYDENGTLLAGWAIYDDVEPYLVEKTYQCEEGKSYTVTFQGYAYGNGSTMYDDINLSVSDICE